MSCTQFGRLGRALQPFHLIRPAFGKSVKRILLKPGCKVRRDRHCPVEGSPQFATRNFDFRLPDVLGLEVGDLTGAQASEEGDSHGRGSCSVLIANRCIKESPDFLLRKNGDLGHILRQLVEPRADDREGQRIRPRLREGRLRGGGRARACGSCR